MIVRRKKKMMMKKRRRQKKNNMKEENSYPSDVRMEMEYVDGATFCAYYLFNNHISSFFYLCMKRERIPFKYVIE